MKKFVIVAVIIAVAAMPAGAATFADMMNSIGASVNALGKFARGAFAVLGFACIGIGLFKVGRGPLFGRQDSPDSRMWWIGIFYWILAGAGLLCLSAFGMMTAETVGLSGTIDF